MLGNNLKSPPPERVTIFSDEKTWTVSPVKNRRNDRYLSFGEDDKSACTLSKKKHPASFISLGFVASNGAVMSLIWFPSGYRLTFRDKEAKLADKLVPWINDTFDMSSVNCVLQQDRCPSTHILSSATFLARKKISFWWSKNIVVAILARRRPTGLCLLSVY